MTTTGAVGRRQVRAPGRGFGAQFRQYPGNHGALRGADALACSEAVGIGRAQVHGRASGHLGATAIPERDGRHRTRRHGAREPFDAGTWPCNAKRLAVVMTQLRQVAEFGWRERRRFVVEACDRGLWPRAALVFGGQPQSSGHAQFLQSNQSATIQSVTPVAKEPGGRCTGD